MHPKMTTVLFLLFSLLAFSQAIQIGLLRRGQQDVGVCYGTFANDQPSAQEAVSLAKSIGIRKMRLYGPDHNALQALRNTGIEVVLGVPNEQLQWVASNQKNANQWIQDNVRKYQDVNFKYIVVGNGITPVHPQTSQFSRFVQPAMQNIANAISPRGQSESRIKVTTAIDQSEVLGKSFPPSAGEFRPEVRQFIQPIIRYLANQRVPLLVNLHPYYSYVHTKADIPLQINKGKQAGHDARLEYALLKSSGMLVQDAEHRYSNYFEAMVDSLYSAMEKSGVNTVDIVVSETGWPTAGGPAASNENAAAHNNNLINRVRTKGTPKRPQKRIETFIFSMFDENKNDQEVERHWGIFSNNKQAKYKIIFQ
ncbi:hypothetical protein AgCh_038221 [Apium graveolens]